MKFKRDQKLKHKKYGICYFYGEMYGGDAIVEIYRNKKFVDRISTKYEDLEARNNSGRE